MLRKLTRLSHALINETKWFRKVAMLKRYVEIYDQLLNVVFSKRAKAMMNTTIVSSPK